MQSSVLRSDNYITQEVVMWAAQDECLCTEYEDSYTWPTDDVVKGYERKWPHKYKLKACSPTPRCTLHLHRLFLLH